MKTVKKLTTICLAVLMLFAIVACDQTELPTPDTTKPDSADTTTAPAPSDDNTDDNTPDDTPAVTSELTLTADKTAAAPGETVTFSTVLKVGEETSTPEGVTYAIVEGATNATIAANVLTVNETVANGAVIKVKATVNGVDSNVVTVTVVKPLTAIAISTTSSELVTRGSGIILNKALTPADCAATVTWTLVEGADAASIVGDVLVINSDAADNATIKVKAVSGSIESNVLTFTVDVPDTVIPLTSLAISAPVTGEVTRGSSIALEQTKTPANSTDVVTWAIVAGSDYATMAGNVLVINPNAAGGTVISVKAVSGSIESNTLTFTVAFSQEEINNSRYFMSFDEETITFDKNGLFTPLLNVTVYNFNFEEITDCTIDYAIQSGSEFISLTPNGYACTLTALGHGEATISATIRGTSVTETATVKVIVPPQAINLPEMFRERPNLNYSFSMKNPDTQAAYTLPFTATPYGELVCQDMLVTFTHADGSTGDAVATYTNGAITFLKEGLVTATVSSNSGSRHETTVSYKFNVNRGYNISTFEELVALGGNASYTGSLPINFVVTSKPIGADKTYGYDIVPATALKAKADQTIDEIKSSTHAAFVNKGVIIHANRHKIDASQLRVPTSNELVANDSWSSPGNLLEIIPYSATQLTDIAAYTVEINDLTVIGNAPINYETESASPFGVYYRGIKIGGESNDNAPANYRLTMNNVSVEAFRTGMRLMHVVYGQVNNAKVDNCFGNGFEIGSSIINLQNITYGACGAVGIEVVPQDSDKAGVNQNQPQQITFSGVTNFTFMNSIDNNKQTVYMSNYNLGGLSVPAILQGAIEYNQLTPYQYNHIVNMQEGENFGTVGYVTFQFNDIGAGKPNVSQIIYPAWQEGGIINAKDLPTSGIDTTHQYIELDMTLSVPNMGVVPAGKAYFVNLYYVPAN